jgi:acetyltransferase-like isoleucine patch superfamily enzyme
VTVAEGCKIGSGTTVIKDTEIGTVYAGSPARKLKVNENYKIS